MHQCFHFRSTCPFRSFPCTILACCWWIDDIHGKTVNVNGLTKNNIYYLMHVNIKIIFDHCWNNLSILLLKKLCCQFRENVSNHFSPCFHSIFLRFTFSDLNLPNQWRIVLSLVVPSPKTVPKWWISVDCVINKHF